MDPLEIIFGKDFSDKQKLLKEELLKIENENITFFKKRKPKFEQEKYDRLHNHWVMLTEPPKITFTFVKDSDIPDSIKKKCCDTFQKIFSNKEEE